MKIILGALKITRDLSQVESSTEFKKKCTVLTESAEFGW